MCTIGGISLIISIHALHEESDSMRAAICGAEFLFQSTLSMRRATPLPNQVSSLIVYFNPRSP